jgi:hypothetical protein
MEVYTPDWSIVLFKSIDDCSNAVVPPFVVFPNKKEENERECNNKDTQSCEFSILNIAPPPH